MGKLSPRPGLGSRRARPRALTRKPADARVHIGEASEVLVLRSEIGGLLEPFCANLRHGKSIIERVVRSEKSQARGSVGLVTLSRRVITAWKTL
jgi:hypothetical protein